MGFPLGPVELELRVEPSSEAGGEAGIKFWLVSIGEKGGPFIRIDQTLRLQLTPLRHGQPEPIVVEAEPRE